MIRRPTTALAAALLIILIAGATAAAERRSGYDVVLVHGIGSSADVWHEVVPALELGFNVWTFEMPGHGRTPRAANATIASFADSLGAYIAAHDIRNPLVVGHGLGGMVAMTWAFDHPADLDRLALIDAAPVQLATDEQKAAVAEQLAVNYDRFVANTFLNMSPSEEVNQLVLDQALRTDPITFQQLMMSGFDFDLTDQLALQSIPILVVGSSMLFPDPAFAQEQMDLLGYGKARAVSFKTMPGVGHFVMLEQPGYLASVLMAFGTPGH